MFVFEVQPIMSNACHAGELFMIDVHYGNSTDDSKYYLVNGDSTIQLLFTQPVSDLVSGEWVLPCAAMSVINHDDAPSFLLRPRNLGHSVNDCKHNHSN